MDSLVRMRYLFDTLEPGEQLKAIKRIATTCGPQWIMTLIFNHFAERLHSDSEDQSTSAAITKAISSVITDRQTDPKCNDVESPIDGESDTEDEPLSVEELPSVMVSNVASYLNQKDYFHFMHSSRRIMIGCHSPFSLYHLHVYHRNRLSTNRDLKSRYGQRDAVNTAKSLLTNSNIRRLTIIRKGKSSLDGGDEYLKFISHSPNIKCIETPISIPLSSSKLKLPTMRALKGIDYHFGSDIFSEVQHKLIRKHSNQIESLKLLSEQYYISSLSPNHRLCSLTELKTGRISDTLSNRVLFEWIKQSSKLKMFSIDCSEVESVSNLIIFLILFQPNLHFTEFVYDAVNGRAKSICNAMEFMEQIGNGLAKSILNEVTKVYEDREEFKVRIRCKGGWMDRKEQHETATNILMEILRDHGPLTIDQLNREFNASQSVSWKMTFKNDLGNFQLFVRNHKRFRIVPSGGLGKYDQVQIKETKDSERLHCFLRIHRLQKATKVIDGVGYLLMILEGCNLRHFMVQIIVRLRGYMRTSKQQQVEDMEGGIDDLVQKWKERYRVDTFYESKGKLIDDRWRITFCNKDNPMEGGYGAHGLFIE